VNLKEIKTRILSARTLLSRLDEAKLCGDDPAEICALAAELEFQVSSLERELSVVGGA
jgi:hypothetical protein